MIETVDIPTIANRAAVISGISGAASLVALCVGIFPIPLTGLVCFPAAVLCGVAAVAAGVTALRRASGGQQDGRSLAIAGTITGGAVILATICATAAGIALTAGVAQWLRSLPR